MKLSINLIKAINKHISRATKNLNLLKANLLDLFLLFQGFVRSFFCSERKKLVVRRELKIKSEQDIVINCLGCLDLRSDLNSFSVDLCAIKGILTDADISFVSSRFGKHSTDAYSSLSKRLKTYRIYDVAFKNKFIKSTLYHTQAGTVAVCACMMSYASASKHRIRVELVQEYHMLKRMGADYVIIYMDSKLQHITTEKNKQLCNLLLKAGVDYIVNVKPGALDSGVTFRQRNSSVSRAVYSTGTFLSNRNAFPAERAIIRVKLRQVNGKLQAFEESYYPLRWTQENGMRNLIAQDAVLTADDVTALAKVERSLPRLRRVDKIITVGTIVDVVGATLPDQFAYIKDFSVGRLSARTTGHMPGDVYIRWRPHTEANDASTYKKRVRFAKKQTLIASKINLFIVTYKRFGLKTPHVVVEDSMEAHVAIGAFLRKQHDLRCVAITGSIGKTSTKDMLAEVMKLKYNTVKSEKNENIHSKISLALQRITSECDVYIQELGGGRPGGASRHARMVLPEATVVTNIGDAHIGNFDGDPIALMNNKLEIIDGMDENGILYLNGDDPLLVNAQPNCKRILFAVHNKNADYYAEDMVVDGNSTHFNIVHDGHKVAACVKVPGEHNVLNAICSFAIGKQFDIPEEVMVKGIANFKTHGIRQNVVHASGRKLFFDCYNASSGSVESSIKTLGQIKIPKNCKRVAVVGDITGLGDLAVTAHKEIAQPLIENPADIFLFYGKNTQYTYDIVKEAGFESYFISNHDELCKKLIEITKPGDAVMAKGSSKMQLEYAFDRAFGTRTFDAAMLEEGAYYRAEVNGVAYNLFGTHATAVKPQQDKAHIRVNQKVGVVPVQNIATTFSSPILEDVELPNGIRHIGIHAFRDSKKLKRVAGAVNLKYIGTGAFKNCVSLESMPLPETLLHIGSEAFMGCTSLKELYIPESVVQIGPNAFTNCHQLMISCKAESYAEAYLKKYNIPYTCKP